MNKNINKYIYVILIFVCSLFLFLILNIKNSNEIDYEEEIETININEEEHDLSEKDTNYYVDIKGEVTKPGVYEISSDSRIIDVINKAGGLTKNADTSLLNLSKKVVDEMNIKIYSKSEVKNAKESVNKEPTIVEIIKEVEKECVCPSVNDLCNSNKNGALIDEEDINKDETSKKLININTATKEELMTIPDIGEVKAKSIIEYREKNKFTKIEDILNVSGIKESTYEKIKEYITI